MNKCRDCKYFTHMKAFRSYFCDNSYCPAKWVYEDFGCILWEAKGDNHE